MGTVPSMEKVYHLLVAGTITPDEKGVSQSLPPHLAGLIVMLPFFVPQSKIVYVDKHTHRGRNRATFVSLVKSLVDNIEY